MNAREYVSNWLKVEEGNRNKPYVDTVGKITIGIGRNLTDIGLHADEIELLFKNDIDDAINVLTWHLPFFENLDDVRKAVLIDMCFNMGWPTFSKFTNTLHYVANGDYSMAATQMLNSKWAKQVGNRAIVLARRMKTGQP